MPHQSTSRPIRTNKILRVASDTTWAAAIDKARAKLGFVMPTPPKLTAKEERDREALRRAVYGPKPPEVDVNWLFTPHPYPEIARVLITPEVSAKLIDVMVENRKPDPERIATYARQQAEDYWVFTNEGWAVNSKGEFQDGGNRAAAQQISGVTLDVLMCVGMPVDNFIHLNQGKPRSKKDMNDIDKLPHASLLSTAVTMVMQYDLWQEKTHLNWRAFRPTNDEYKGCRDPMLPTILDGVTVGFRLRKRVRVSPGATAAAYYLLHRVPDGSVRGAGAPSDVVNKFFAALTKGANLDENNPIAVVRDHFWARADSAERKYNNFVETAMLIKAWNALVDLKRPERVIFAATEGYPHPKEWKPELLKHPLWSFAKQDSGSGRG